MGRLNKTEIRTSDKTQKTKTPIRTRSKKSSTNIELLAQLRTRLKRGPAKKSRLAFKSEKDAREQIADSEKHKDKLLIEIAEEFKANRNKNASKAVAELIDVLCQKASAQGYFSKDKGKKTLKKAYKAMNLYNALNDKSQVTYKSRDLLYLSNTAIDLGLNRTSQILFSQFLAIKGNVWIVQLPEDQQLRLNEIQYKLNETHKLKLKTDGSRLNEEKSAELAKIFSKNYLK